jgi:hypothetical protein
MSTGETLKMQNNFETIRSHLNLLFGDQKDGQIEIAYTPPFNKSINQASFFNVTDIDAAARFAAETNAKDGVNVYVGAALRSPNAAPFGRSSVDDYYASSFVWVDLDDPEAAKSAKEKYKDLPPSFVVVTGRHPHVRAQCWWRLDNNEHDKAELKATLGQMCARLGGDKAVVDPIRVMRLGGTIAWPKKEGRIPEITELLLPENATKSVSLQQLKSHYPPVDFSPVDMASAGGAVGLNLQPQKSPLNLTNKSEFSLNDIESMLKHLNPDSDYTDWVSVGMALKDYGAPFEIWNAWSAKGSKYNAHEMRQKWDSFKGSGTTIGTLCHMAKMNGWRYESAKKIDYQYRPENNERFNPITGEIIEDEHGVIKATSIHDIDLDHIPPREFLYADIVARKYVSMIIAPAGVGKSIFSMQLAISAATGEPWGEWRPKQAGLNVWVYNNEEGNDELRRRIKAILAYNGLNKSDFQGGFYLDSGETQAITIARVDRDGESVIATPDYEALVAEIKARKIDILVIDPFAETHAVSENSNDKIKIVTGLYRKIAFDANCAVLLIHHARKGVENLAGNADAGRGGGAQIGVVRRAFTLAKMSKEEADDIGVPPERRHWYVRLDDAKSNITAPSEKTTWLQFKSVAVGNGNAIYPDGDSVGILKHTDIDSIKGENGNVISQEEDRILQCIVEYSQKIQSNDFSFNDAKEYIQDFSSYNYGMNKLANLMKSAMGKNSIIEFMGGKFRAKFAPKKDEKNKLFIYVSEV